MNKKFIYLTAIFLLSFTAFPNVSSAQNSLQFTTYYPSPSGVYSRLRLAPSAANGDPCNSTRLGTFYLDSTTRIFTFCRDDNTWGPMPGIFWTGKDNNVFLSAIEPALSNTFVGIGTSAPQSKLHVTGGELSLEGERSGLSNPISAINFINDDSGTKYLAAQITSHNQGSINDGNLRFYTTQNGVSSEKLRITEDGDVGIRTETPSSTLHLKDNTAALTLEGARTTVAGAIAAIEFRNVDSGNYLAARIASYNEGSVNDGNLRFYTAQGGSNTEKVRITEDGNVGIGAPNPSARLEIEEGLSGTTGLIVKTPSSGLNDVIASFKRQSTGLFSSKGMIDLNTDISSLGAMPYIHFTTEGSATDHWSIGTVLDGIYGNQGFRIANDGNSLNTKPYFSILNNGNVGIGNTNPASELHIYENSTNTGANAGLTIEQAGSGDAVAQFLIKSSDKRWVMGADNSDGDKFKISSNANLLGDVEMVIDGDNNFGIGLADPLATLHIKGAGNKPTLVIISGNLNTTAPATLRVTERKDYYEGGFFSYNGANDKLTIGINRSASADPSTDNDRIIIVNNGNVGIGKTNPSATLHVGGNLKVDVLSASGSVGVDWNSSTKEFGTDIAEFFPSKEGFLQSSTPAALHMEGGVIKANGQNIVLGLTPIQPAMLIEGSWSQIGPKPEDLIQEGKSPVALLGRVPVKYTGKVVIGDTLVVNSNGDVVRWQKGLNVLGYVGLVLDVDIENKMAVTLTGHHGLLRVIDTQQETINNLIDRIEKLESREN